FRSAFMMRNLDWLQELNIEYDCSTFDTDPFEPQPDGVNTIFPFWVPAPCAAGQDSELKVQSSKFHSGSRNSEHSTVNPAPSTINSPSINYPRSGYVELPYTLPQDSTLFTLFRKRGIDV